MRLGLSAGLGPQGASCPSTSLSEHRPVPYQHPRRGGPVGPDGLPQARPVACVRVSPSLCAPAAHGPSATAMGRSPARPPSLGSGSSLPLVGRDWSLESGKGSFKVELLLSDSESCSRSPARQPLLLPPSRPPVLRARLVRVRSAHSAGADGARLLQAQALT